MRMPAKNLFAAATLLVLWIVVPLLSLAHVALEEHTYCAEHQRLEEAQDAHGKSLAARALDAAEDHAEPPVARSGDGSTGASDGGHESCAFGDDFTRDAQCVPHTSVGIVPAIAFLVLPKTRLAPAKAAIRLIHLAPKNSPPQRA
tara:strand:- start:33639 stop:34073 length:435 start_codon:yes stop_codon:yes gene_type:complete